ncbi:MAG: hypothetical protein NZ899_02575 [Thermoguttaceae bacterium]|nr:hypothetical protein [Thermoguttaceae bacterium]MDW8079790.1 hypothetical protein [Thermoguttaceae bacterium]
MTTALNDLLEKWAETSPDDLQPEQAYDLAFRLGDFAPYLLADKVLEKATQHSIRLLGNSSPPFLRRRISLQEALPPGSCPILVANRSPERCRLVRPGFVFPVRWVGAREHDRRLPKSLHETADKVRAEVAKYLEAINKDSSPAAAGRRPVEEYFLRPEPPGLLTNVDTEAVCWDFQSAWATLVAGLLLAYWNATPRPGIVATGARGEDKVAKVDCVEAKVQAAIDFGVEVLFVPDEQHEDFKEVANSLGAQQLKVRKFGSQPGSCRKLLGLYLDELQVPPGKDAPQEDRARYYWLLQDPRKAADYYQENILPEVAELLRRKLEDCSAQISHVVLSLSQSPQLAELVAFATRPQSILVFTNENIEKYEEEFDRFVKNHLPSTKVIKANVSVGSSWDELRDCYSRSIKNFLGSAPPNSVLVDLTAGKKIMSLACLEACPPGAWLLCIESSMLDGRIRPFTEKFHILQKRTA